MPYPILPLIFAWGTSYQYEERVNSGRYEDGVELFERAGINRRNQSIDVSVNIVNPVPLDTFLREQRGKPFRIQTVNQIEGEDFLYSCSEWEMPEVSRGCWNFKGKLIQVRRFEKKIVKRVELSSDKTTMNSGSSSIFTVGVSGYSVFPNIVWLVNGLGSISRISVNQARYIAPSNLNVPTTADISVRLPDESNRLVSLRVRIEPIQTITSIQINPSSEYVDFFGGPLDLEAIVFATGYGINRAVNWTIQSGIAVLSNVKSNSVRVSVYEIEQTVIVRVTSVADTTIWTDRVISVSQSAVISGIFVEKNPQSILPNGQCDLTAVLIGTNLELVNPGITWSIISGLGTITQDYYASYTARNDEEEAVIRATSVANQLVTQDITISVKIPVKITSVTASSTPIASGGTSQLSAVVLGTGAFSTSVVWSVKQNSTAIGIITTQNNITTYTMPPNTTGLSSTLRATSSQDSTVFGEVTLTVQAATPTPAVTNVVAQASSLSPSAGMFVTLNALISGVGLFNTDVVWSIRPSSTAIGALSAQGSSTIYTIPSNGGGLVSTLRATSVQNPSIFSEVILNILSASASAAKIKHDHVQVNSALVWIIRHGLNCRPIVSTADSLGKEIYGRVEYTNSNDLTITFSSPESGFAHLV